MPNQLGYTDISATKRYAMTPSKLGPSDNVVIFTLGAGNSSWTCSGTFQANPFTAIQDPNNLGWQNVAAVRQDTLVQENTPTLTANTANNWKTSCDGFAQMAFNVTAITGDIPLNIISFYDPAGSGFLVTTPTTVPIPVNTLAVGGTAIGNAAVVPITGSYAYITVTGSNNSAAIKLPVGSVGMQVTIQNTVQTATLQVFPQVNNLINNLANNAVYNIPNGGKRIFTYTSAGVWYTDPQTIV